MTQFVLILHGAGDVAVAGGDAARIETRDGGFDQLRDGSAVLNNLRSLPQKLPGSTQGWQWMEGIQRERLLGFSEFLVGS